MSKDYKQGLSESERGQAGEIYTKYHKLVRAEIRERTHCNSVEEDDLTAEVFERVCRSFKNGSGPINAHATKKWLMKIVENECLKFLKKGKRRTTVSLESPVFQGEDEMLRDQIADNDDSPEEIAEQQEIARVLITALKELSPRLQRVVFLYYMQGWTLGQISEISGQTFSTVRRDREKGIQQLHERLVDE